MRLGEILVAAGLITPPQLQHVLARKETRPWERLGTHVVHLGLATPDQVSLALANQYDIPAALVRHFVHHDPKAAKLIGPKVATAHSLLPIAFSRTGGANIVICFRDPNQPELIAKLEKALGIAVSPCVASELAIGIYLDHYYGTQPVYGMPPEVSDDSDFDVDIDFEETKSGLESLNLVDLDHRDVERAAPDAFVPEDQRRSALHQALAAAQANKTGIDALDLIAAEPKPKPTPTPDPVSLVVPAVVWQDLPDLIHAIDQATERSAVSEAIMSFMKQRFSAGMMFTVKDGLAMGHQGFGGHLNDKDTVAALMLPVRNGILGAAHDSAEVWRGNPAELSSVAQKRFLTLFDVATPPSDVVVAPVAVAGRILCLLYAHDTGSSNLDDGKVEELVDIADATQKAFTRLIQESRNKSSPTSSS